MYQTAEKALPDRRHFRGQELITGKAGNWPPAEAIPFAHTPGRKFGVREVIAVLRDNRGIASIYNETTQEAAVFQLRDKLPRELGCIYWRTTGRPDASLLTPWYAGVTSTPEKYGRRAELAVLLSLDHHFKPPAGTFEADPGRAWWKFKTLAMVTDEGYSHRIGKVRTAALMLEERVLQRQASWEAGTLKLWQANPDEARAELTRYCTGLADEACAEADKLSAAFAQEKRNP